MTRSDLIEIIARAIESEMDASFDTWMERWVYAGGTYVDAPDCPKKSEFKTDRAGARILSALSAAGLAVVPREALPDAIRRPMGVIPASAEGWVTVAELDAAERRRAMVAAKDLAG